MTTKEYIQKIEDYRKNSKYDEETGFSHKTIKCSTCQYCKPGDSCEYNSCGPTCSALKEGPDHYGVIIDTKSNSSRPDITDSSDCDLYRPKSSRSNLFSRILKNFII